MTTSSINLGVFKENTTAMTGIMTTAQYLKESFIREKKDENMEAILYNIGRYPQHMCRARPGGFHDISLLQVGVVVGISYQTSGSISIWAC